MIKRLPLPSPLAIAAGLTLFTMLFALFLTTPEDKSVVAYAPDILGFWHKGFWNLLAFAMQMMLMLGLGYVLALSPVVDRGIDRLLTVCNTNASAIFVICLSTLVVAFFNWGLGLVFGAIICRKFGEHFQDKGIPFNYPLMGAAGYAGLLVWHGGFSGSAPLKVAESGHFLEQQIGVVPINETILSPMNLVVSAALLIVLPVFCFWLARRAGTEPVAPGFFDKASLPANGGGKVKWQPLAVVLGLLLLFLAFSLLVNSSASIYKQVNPNFINLLLLGLSILLMGNFSRFLAAVDQAIVSTSGIMIQFPLYAGIMGIMKYSGLMALISEGFTSISTELTFPLFTFVSAGIVNIFVPSGGGQWAVQGPIIVEAAQQIGVDTPKSIMAMAYGDQMTNMIQPFWALPLLGITGLKAGQILPYSFRLMLVGGVVFLTGLLVF